MKNRQHRNETQKVATEAAVLWQCPVSELRGEGQKPGCRVAGCCPQVMRHQFWVSGASHTGS